jgi:hypothetical protein
MNMILLSETSGYRVYAEVLKPLHPKDAVCLKIHTQWEDAKDPEGLQNKLSLMIDKKALSNLETLLSVISKQLREK